MAVYNLWLTLEVNLRELTSVPPWISVKMEEKRQKCQIPQFGTAEGKNENTQNYCQVMENNNEYDLWSSKIFISTVYSQAWDFPPETPLCKKQTKINFRDRQGKNEHTKNGRQVMVNNNEYDHWALK